MSHGVSTLESAYWRQTLIALASIALAAGLSLSLLSLWEFCTTACAEGNKYRIFGIPFAWAGVGFFLSTSILWIFSFRFPQALTLFKCAVACGIGAESYFLYVQKYLIGKWCPICLGVFACIALLTAIVAVDYFKQLAITKGNRSLFMQQVKNGIGFISLSLMTVLLMAFGVVKTEKVFSETIGNEPLYFGNKTNAVDVYVFTDWFCPACRKAEASIEKQAPMIAKLARLFFIDVPIHDESMNFIPYNLSFMLKEKTKYLKLRHKLEDLASKDKTPSDQDVQKLAESIGTRYHQLDYSEVNQGIKYFQNTASKYGVDSTPTIVVVNPKTKKSKKLTGAKEIGNANFPELIHSLSSP